MRVLVLGSGGREHALCWKLAQSPLLSQLFCCPGNEGIAQIATCISGEPVEVAQQIGADFVVVGPDGLLADGIVDRLNSVGIRAFGPTKQAAQLESSKIFCKNLLRKYQIPTAQAASFDSPDDAKTYISNLPDDVPVVVKADGLAVGKGVVVAQNRAEAIAAVDEVLGIAHSTSGENNRVLVEEWMTGEEVSLMAITDGETILPFATAQDHKRIGEGDVGANTGGMGCYSPVPAFSTKQFDDAIENILKPTLAGLKAEGIRYRGVLYAGLMLTPNGTRVVEFNARFGDPETQVVLPRLKSDLLPLLLACSGHIEYSIAELPCEWTDEAAVCVVMAAGGYPAAYQKGDAISGLPQAAQNGALVFHAGTSLRDNQIVTDGGRVLGITALGDGFHDAREKCYDAVEKIGFDGAYFRRDIGWRCL